MPRIVIAGPPGAGKTTLLDELARRGYRTVSDSAREVIRERKAAGLPPRPDALEFALQILGRDIEKYQAVADLPGFIFFERCGLEPLATICAMAQDAASGCEAGRPHFVFHEQVFILPPGGRSTRSIPNAITRSFTHGVFTPRRCGSTAHWVISSLKCRARRPHGAPSMFCVRWLELPAEASCLVHRS